MLSRTRFFACWALAVGSAFSSLACSALTEPHEITVSIAAEPLPTAPAPGGAAPGANPGPARPAMMQPGG